MRPVGIQIASDNIFFPFSIVGLFIWAIISALFQLIAFLLVKISIIIWFFIAFLHSAVQSKVYQQYRNTHIKRIKYKQSVSYTHYAHTQQIFHQSPYIFENCQYTLPYIGFFLGFFSWSSSFAMHIWYRIYVFALSKQQLILIAVFFSMMIQQMASNYCTHISRIFVVHICKREDISACTAF